jgi:hypothetical protein
MDWGYMGQLRCYIPIAVTITPAGDPTTYKYAISTLEADLWRCVMEEEIKMLEDNKTAVLVDLPAGKQAIKCKWVCLMKCDTQGNIACHKAHLITKGFTQTHSINY